MFPLYISFSLSVYLSLPPPSLSLGLSVWYGRPVCLEAWTPHWEALWLWQSQQLQLLPPQMSLNSLKEKHFTRTTTSNAPAKTEEYHHQLVSSPVSQMIPYSHYFRSCPQGLWSILLQYFGNMGSLRQTTVSTTARDMQHPHAVGQHYGTWVLSCFVLVLW